MGRSAFRYSIVIFFLIVQAFGAIAQEAAPAAVQADETAVLTAEELQKLVAPVALYPDTLLIQILIAATAPLDVVKADRLLGDNPDPVAADLEQKIKDAQFDPSVEVLAVGFPALIREMAVHIDWTESIGIAMLAQSQDVLAAVQVMRALAINTGALKTSPQMVVSEDPVTSTVIVQPADPEVVYVPQYDSNVVYDNSVSDAVVTGLIIFAVVAVIDEIFDDDDDWHGYWGCRNCGGWENGVIIRNPDIDINVDGNVNIGNDINVAWKPDNDRVVAAHNQIAVKRGANGATKLRLDRPASPSDQLRTEFGSGAARDGNLAGQNFGADRPAGDGPAAGNLAARTPNAKPLTTSKTKAKPAAKPKASTTGTSSKKPKVAKTSTAKTTRSASTRGRASSSRSRR